MASKVKLFVSERNLQSEFILEAKSLYPSCELYPEYAVTIGGKTCHIDLLIKDMDEEEVVEFKYVVGGGKINLAYGGTYTLKKQAAINIRRYQIYKDIERLEELKSSKGITGYVCLITNMKGFWNGSPRTKKAKDFELKDGTVINAGKHGFSGTSALSKTYHSISLKGKYRIKYDDYCTSYGDEYKSLVIKV